MAAWRGAIACGRPREQGGGILDDVAVDKVLQFESDLLHYLQQHHPELKKEVATIGKIDDKVGGRLKEIINTFKQKMGYGAKS